MRHSQHALAKRCHGDLLCERAWSNPGVHTEDMWEIQRIRTAVKPRSLNLGGMLALPLPRSGLVQNLLWGAPRIHGELLKLGIPVSERTVSRYLQGRMKAPSQSWRTFLANEFSQLTLAATVTSSDEPGDHDVAAARLCPSVQLRLHATSSRSQCRAGGVRRLAPLASMPASWSASCPGSRAPPHGPPPTDKTRRSRVLSKLGPN
jgi:hypothetical protein